MPKIRPMTQTTSTVLLWPGVLISLLAVGMASPETGDHAANHRVLTQVPWWVWAALPVLAIALVRWSRVWRKRDKLFAAQWALAGAVLLLEAPAAALAASLPTAHGDRMLACSGVALVLLGIALFAATWLIPAPVDHDAQAGHPDAEAALQLDFDTWMGELLRHRFMQGQDSPEELHATHRTEIWRPFYDRGLSAEDAYVAWTRRRAVERLTQRALAAHQLKPPANLQGAGE